MGSGRWSTDTHAAAAAYRAAAGADPFDYSARTHAGPHRAWTAHPDLDPFGVRVRESRDSGEHPTSLAIAVIFDVTGSMGYVPRRLQENCLRCSDCCSARGTSSTRRSCSGGSATP
jgi:hypothetical protein